MLEAFDVRQLPEEGAELDEALLEPWLEASLNEGSPEELTFNARGPGRARISLSPIAQRGAAEPAVRVSGRVKASLRTHCVRCLVEIELELSSPVEVTLMPAESSQRELEEGPPAKGKKGKKPVKVEIPKEALDESSYENHLIDVPGIVREALLLGLEMNPSCADEQACSARTQELVQIVNVPSETTPAIDPRWADLEKLRSKSS